MRHGGRRVRDGSRVVDRPYPWREALDLRRLTARARVKIACGDSRSAEDDLHDALVVAAKSGHPLPVPDTFECLAQLACAARVTTKLPGSLARRMHCGSAWERSVSRSSTPGTRRCYRAIRNAIGDNDFDTAWAEGAALSTDEAIAYAQRGRGERKRPSSGWESLTPTELDVVRLVAEGIPNKDIATRLFVSPRTVQSHLRHVYNKLGVTSRVQLAQEAARSRNSFLVVKSRGCCRVIVGVRVPGRPTAQPIERRGPSAGFR